MLKYNHRNSGFSLLEVIIGVSILSIGIVMVLQALAFSSRVTGLSCDMINAVFLAEDKIQELEFKERQNLIKDGKTKEEKDKFEWEYNLDLDPDLSLDDFKIYKLNFELTWQRANREEKFNLNTYFFKQ